MRKISTPMIAHILQKLISDISSSSLFSIFTRRMPVFSKERLAFCSKAFCYLTSLLMSWCWYFSQLVIPTKASRSSSCFEMCCFCARISSWLVFFLSQFRSCSEMYDGSSPGFFPAYCSCLNPLIVSSIGLVPPYISSIIGSEDCCSSISSQHRLVSWSFDSFTSNCYQASSPLSMRSSYIALYFWIELDASSRSDFAACSQQSYLPVDFPSLAALFLYV